MWGVLGYKASKTKTLANKHYIVYSSSSSLALGVAKGEWVRSQRKKHAAGKLKPTEIAALEEIGIAWSVKQSPQPWEVRYQQLVEFKNKHQVKRMRELCCALCDL